VAARWSRRQRVRHCEHKKLYKTASTGAQLTDATSDIRHDASKEYTFATECYYETCCPEKEYGRVDCCIRFGLGSAGTINPGVQTCNRQE
jgi:hypothetical protein